MGKARIENALPLNRTVFLDRAVPDSIAYYRLEGLDPSDGIDRLDSSLLVSAGLK
jgi:hypothetical protein